MGAFCCCFDNVDYEGEVDLRHFELLQIVGKGAFGKVSDHNIPHTRLLDNNI